LEPTNQPTTQTVDDETSQDIQDNNENFMVDEGCFVFENKTFEIGLSTIAVEDDPTPYKDKYVTPNKFQEAWC
jgi:hypothetical protein